MPGNDINSSLDAVFIFTSPSVFVLAVPPALFPLYVLLYEATCFFVGIITCSPSLRSIARFTDKRAAVFLKPPAAFTASHNLCPLSRLYTPGCFTAPQIYTAIISGGICVLSACFPLRLPLSGILVLSASVLLVILSPVPSTPGLI